MEISDALLKIDNMNNKIEVACNDLYNKILNIQNGEDLEQFINYINNS